MIGQNKHRQLNAFGLRRKSIQQVLLIAVAVILFLFFMLPFIMIILNVGKSSSAIISDPLGATGTFARFFENVQTILNNDKVRYISSFGSSALITVLSVALIVVLSSMAAWALVRAKTKMSNFIFMVFVAAMVIPFQVVMLPLARWFRMVSEATHIPLLYTYQGIIFAYIGFGASLSIFLFHGFIKSIPQELEEAAWIDGCSRPAIFFRIVLPLLKPVTVTVIILNGIWIWNDYLLPLIILSIGKPVQTLPLAVQNFVGSFVKQWDLILTAALLAMIPIIIVFLFCQKYIIKGMTEGAIK